MPDLKKELKLRGLSTTGNKNELLERLQSALHSDNSVSPETVEDFEEHLLNEVLALLSLLPTISND